MLSNVEILNRKFAECLGTRGGQTWWAWKWAPDMVYEHRDQPGESFGRVSWARWIGRSWVLCQFRPPEITRNEWDACYKGEIPFPERGRYVPHPEVRIEGREPDMEDTIFYIRTLAMQFETPQEVQHKMSLERIQERSDRTKREFFDQAEEDFPAFWKNGVGHEPGTRGSHVSFGGV